MKPAPVGTILREALAMMECDVEMYARKAQYAQMREALVALQALRDYINSTESMAAMLNPPELS